MSSHGVIDLRPGRGGKKPPAGQTSLFGGRPSRGRDAPQKRPLPLRARRRRVRAGIIVGILIVLAGLVFGVHYVSYLPQLSVQRIVVVGAKDVQPQLVSDYVQSILDDGSYHFLSRKNIFLYPAKVIEKDVVANFPRIDSVHASRPALFSTELDVAVTERQPVALWCDPSALCYQMDKSGFIFAVAPVASSTGYVFQGGLPAQAGIASDSMDSTSSPQASTNPIGKLFASTHLPALTALLTELGQAGFTPQGATVENDSDFSVPLTQGFLLKASFGESPDQLVKNLQLVLVSEPLVGKEAQLEYVDLRFGDRVYYKLQGQVQATSTPQ